jgi:hypothetical protein
MPGLALKHSLLEFTGNLMKRTSLGLDSPAHFPNHGNIEASNSQQWEILACPADGFAY